MLSINRFPFRFLILTVGAAVFKFVGNAIAGGLNGIAGGIKSALNIKLPDPINFTIPLGTVFSTPFSLLGGIFKAMSGIFNILFWVLLAITVILIVLFIVGRIKAGRANKSVRQTEKQVKKMQKQMQQDAMNNQLQQAQMQIQQDQIKKINGFQ